MESRGRVVCPENEPLEEYIWAKWQSMAQSPKPPSENSDKAIQKAYLNVCSSKTPIVTLKDFSGIKGVGKWILKLMQGFFIDNNDVPVETDLGPKGKKLKSSRQYMPQKNSVAYALLITLYRGTMNGCEFMQKQELIDAAEASGLSRAPVVPEKGKGKPGQFGSSPREWYSGWSCMKTLISKGLAVKSSCPAKYMLTEEGRRAAQECMVRSNMVDSLPKSDIQPRNCDSEEVMVVDSETESAHAYIQVESSLVDTRKQSYIGSKKNKQSCICQSSVPPEYLNKFAGMGFGKEEIFHAFAEVSKASPNRESSSLWPAVLCCLREKQVYGSQMESQPPYTRKTFETSTEHIHIDATLNRCQVNKTSGGTSQQESAPLRPSSISVQKNFSCNSKVECNVLRMPPLNSWETFEEIYEVILILDNREHFARGSKSGKLIENICKQFNMKIEVRCLPVGDAIWIARHRQLSTEYVLDFIVERKKVDDLRQSITDNRYRDQKLRLLRSGLKKLIYVVEGDPNCLGAADSIKTACFTTEILEEFDVQRTEGLGETLRKYGYITKKIAHCYHLLLSEDRCENKEKCMTFKEFIRRCETLDKMSVSDVFATQLMQVPQVSEEAAIAVLDVYPTLWSLACAYSLLEGDQQAQEELLKKQTNDAVNGSASRNIYRLVWGS
ncbi:hypothetical protein V2J09_017502 [Rumex salicifolius]